MTLSPDTPEGLRAALQSRIIDLKDVNRRRYQSSSYDRDGRAVKEELEDAFSLIGEVAPAGEGVLAYGARLRAVLQARRDRVMSADPDDWASVALNWIIQALDEELAKRAG